MNTSRPLGFEEAFRVIKVDDHNYVGAHPLRLPVPGARGVYGGHTCAQTLLVAIESSPGYVPYAFHSYFIGAGSARVPMEYNVTEISDEDSNYTHRSIKVTQRGKAKYTALVSFVKQGVAFDSSRNNVDIQIPRSKLMREYSNNTGKLKVVEHTDYIRNAYSPEFKNYHLVPEENKQAASERWVTIWGGINNNNAFSNKKTTFLDPRYNYVGLADLSDSAILTTLARILHLDWNPTKDNPFEDFDRQRDARKLLKTSMNMLHLFHYNAMSLDHHIYFHLDNFEDSFNIGTDWVSLTYQAKRNGNDRSLVRGCMFNKQGQCVATIIQEGLTYFFEGVPDNAKL